MKLPSSLSKLSTQTWLMILVIVLLLIMIATRWVYISHTAGEAFRNRFVPETERTPTQPTDSIRTEV